MKDFYKDKSWEESDFPTVLFLFKLKYGTSKTQVWQDLCQAMELELWECVSTDAKFICQTLEEDMIETLGRLQKHSLAIVYRNQWLNWFP